MLRPADPDELKDRAVGLIVFGTVDILFGIFCFVLAMMLLIFASASGLGGIKPIHFWMMELFCFFLTGWYVWLGLGSIKGRRWSRALLLVGAWISIFFGTLSLAVLLFLFPDIYNLLADSGMISPTRALGALTSLLGVIAVLQLGFPVMLVMFYGSKSTQLTCERLSPVPCWTDQTPLPLLALSVVALIGCCSVVAAATTNYTVFFFGFIINGWRGMLATALISVVCGYVGWGAYTRKTAAWWVAYAMIVVISASMMLTFSEVDVEMMYHQMSYSSEQIEQLQQFRPFNSTTLVLISCSWGVMASSYLVWVRDLFRPERLGSSVFSYRRRKEEEEALKPKPSNSRIRMRLD